MLHVATGLPFSLWRRLAQTWVCVDGNLAPGDRKERGSVVSVEWAVVSVIIKPQVQK